jgi:hypothetical protein
MLAAVGVLGQKDAVGDITNTETVLLAGGSVGPLQVMV